MNNETYYQVIAWSIAFEGCISLVKLRRTKGNSLEYRPKISLDGCDVNLLKNWKRFVKMGNLTRHRRYHSNWNDLHTWYTTKYKAVQKLLLGIIPYLPSKRKQATLLLEFITNRLNRPKKGWRFDLWQDTWTERDEEIYLEMKKLNKRGKSVEKEKI